MYSAANPDHVLHVHEDWSNHTNISQLGTALRGDGGGAWGNDGITQYGAVVNAPDPYGSLRYVTTNYTTDPPIPPHGSGAHVAGTHWYGAGDVFDAQGDDNAVGGGKNNRGFALPATSYLNKPAKASVVYEWAVRYRGTNWYEGKSVDINAGFSTGVGRFNFDPGDLELGWGAGCSDALCSIYYANGGTTPRLAGLPPTHGYTGPNIFRDNFDQVPIVGFPTVHYKQNRGWGTAAGQFSWGGGALWPPGAANADLQGTNTPLWQAGWLYYKLQITKQGPGGGFGNGRIEMWIGRTPGAMVQVMSYVGDVGQRDGGLVFVDPTGTSDQLVGDVHFFGLASRRYTGGAIIDVGTIRIWSHSRQ